MDPAAEVATTAGRTTSRTDGVIRERAFARQIGSAIQLGHLDALILAT